MCADTKTKDVPTWRPSRLSGACGVESGIETFPDDLGESTVLRAGRRPLETLPMPRRTHSELTAPWFRYAPVAAEPRVPGLAPLPADLLDVLG
jgi:hypothetical protein